MSQVVFRFIWKRFIAINFIAMLFVGLDLFIIVSLLQIYGYVLLFYCNKGLNWTINNSQS